MITLVVINRLGQERKLPAEDGYSVMEVLRDGGVDELQALCRGCCSCATCHVYIDPTYASELPRISSGEKELLSNSQHFKDNSRLSCQVPVSPSMDGMRVTIAPKD